MKGFARRMSLLVAAAALIVSCGKDDEEDTSSLVFVTPAVYFSGSGEKATVSFAADGVDSFYISEKPDGWDDITLDAAARTVTVVVPSDFEDDEVSKSGSVVIAGTSYLGSLRSATLFVGVVTTTDLSDKPANSYLVREMSTHYTFDPVKGDGQAIRPASVGLLWQSVGSLLQYVSLDNGKVSFYTGADSDETGIKEGNAVIGAYDAAGALIWSWHIWATPYDPEGDVLDYANGNKVMGRNLGALDNANSTADEKVASYGLYYQWGRKDPFIGPASYRANNGTGASMYNASNNRVYTTTAASSAETGTVDYSVLNPLCFITGVTASDNDWLWTANDALWGVSKTGYDPCPYGWKVAPAGAFAGLEIDGTPVEADYDAFGWKLSDGSVSSLYLGAGRRIYSNGTIQNVYNPLPDNAPAVRSNPAEVAQPWVGLYWMSGSLAGRQSPALFFWFEKLNTSAGLLNSAPYARANGMSVRCVKDL